MMKDEFLNNTEITTLELKPSGINSTVCDGKEYYKRLYEEEVKKNKELEQDLINASRNLMSVLNTMNDQKNEFDKLKHTHDALLKENQELIGVYEDSEELMKFLKQFVSLAIPIINK